MLMFTARLDALYLQRIQPRQDSFKCHVIICFKVYAVVCLLFSQPSNSRSIYSEIKLINLCFFLIFFLVIVY